MAVCFWTFLGITLHSSARRALLGQQTPFLSAWSARMISAGFTGPARPRCFTAHSIAFTDMLRHPLFISVGRMCGFDNPPQN